MLNSAEREMAQLLIEALNLEISDLGGIEPDQPLFGTARPGWGLDSIDALEIALAVQQKFGVRMRSGEEETRAAFASLGALTAYVSDQHAKLSIDH